MNYFKKIIGRTLFLAFLISCKEANTLNGCMWETSIEVKYTDNTKDTIFDFVKDKKNNEFAYFIKTSQTTLFGSEQLDPCLVVRTRWFEKNIACGVRSFKIIKQKNIIQ